MLADQGHLVVVATMSLFSEVFSWNREHLPNFYEVLVKVDQATLHSRDARGLYGKALSGETKNVVGHDIVFDEPSPHLTVTNNADSAEHLRSLADTIVSGFLAKR